jgi:2-keto-4-pentenoate hydratase/2-oxohepta-3-ene-1,7-dioic acid hydratase in catechol pathway
MKSIKLKEEKIYPSKVVCIGRNYTEHIQELNNDTPDEMVFFIKPNSSISDKLIFPKGHESCHYEAEISFLIEEGKISAVAFGLDLTLRVVQSKLKNKGLPWERSKAFDNAAVFSDFVYLDSFDESLEVELYINSNLVQKGNISLMINKPLKIIKEAESFLSFEDGDILMTGTPKGVGEFKVGDIFEGKIIHNNKVLIEKKFTAL